MISLSRLQPQVPSFPLIWAVDADNSEIVRLLLDSGADPNICCKYVHGSRACWLRPLCHSNHADIVAMLLDAGAEVNALQRSRNDTETALLRAAHFQSFVCEVLIERGADVNIKNERGGTALYRAITMRRYDLAACLVQVRWGRISIKTYIIVTL